MSLTESIYIRDAAETRREGGGGLEASLESLQDQGAKDTFACAAGELPRRVSELPPLFSAPPLLPQGGSHPHASHPN